MTVLYGSVTIRYQIDDYDSLTKVDICGSVDNVKMLAIPRESCIAQWTI